MQRKYNIAYSNNNTIKRSFFTFFYVLSPRERARGKWRGMREKEQEGDTREVDPFVPIGIHCPKLLFFF
jgi:hypothetical protein